MSESVTIDNPMLYDDDGDALVRADQTADRVTLLPLAAGEEDAQPPTRACNFADGLVRSGQLFVVLEEDELACTPLPRRQHHR